MSPPIKTTILAQSRKHSVLEQAANQVAGFAISYPINLVLLPALGFKTGAGKAFVITLIFTVISMIRGYILRRIFNHLHLRGKANHTQCGDFS